jgi:hypothetical protein
MAKLVETQRPAYVSPILATPNHLAAHMFKIGHMLPGFAEQQCRSPAGGPLGSLQLRNTVRECHLFV